MVRNNVVEVIKPTKVKSNSGHIINKDILRVSPYVRVSTEDEEQLNSYESQIQHYTKLIQDNPKWILGEVYADEGISGTQTKKRDEFQRMIIDAVAGKIDLIITKSISRFARNTMDTLKYVRMLKEKNIAIYFEKENINTLTMNGEMLLTILSSLAQQESESISGNVKMGIKMKMKRGEMVGRHRCLGYGYDKKIKKLYIIEEEAEVVRYIYRRYIEGAGGMVIAKELTEQGIKTIRGNSKWDPTAIIRILKNEKYVGDLLQGKTITTDPITHRKIINKGEQEQYLIQNHHEPIISRETFEKVQEIFSKRSNVVMKTLEIRHKYSRKHAFSSITKCGHCGSPTTRRKWHSGKPYEKFVWICTNYLKKGKKSCPESKGIDEKILKDAFIHIYNELRANNMDTLDELVDEIAETVKNNDTSKTLKSINNNINDTRNKINKLVDLKINDKIDDVVYESKYKELNLELENLLSKQNEVEKVSLGEFSIKKRIKDLKTILQSDDKIMEKFDRSVFEKVVDEVVLGSINDDGVFDPYMIIFKLKIGESCFNEFTYKYDKNTYANCNVNTPSINNRHMLINVEFPYFFGERVWAKKDEFRQGKQIITIKIAI